MPYGTGLRRAPCPTRTWSGMPQRSPSGAAGSSGWPVSSCWPTGRASGIPRTSNSWPYPCCWGWSTPWCTIRLLTNRTATWRWMLLLCATDIALVTFGVVIGGGFRSFIFLAHYPTLAVFAVVFSSYWLSLAWTTAVAQGAGSPGHGGPGAGCPAERGGQVLVKNTRQGTGPRPQSSERGVIAIQRNRCCPRSSTAGRRSPFRPRVTSGSQKTGCPNRRCAWNF